MDNQVKSLEEQRNTEIWDLMLKQRWARSGNYIENNLVKFVQVLRHLGIRVSSSETIDALRALELVNINNKQAVKTTLRALLSKDIEKQILFDKAFAIFFSSPEEKEQRFLEGLRRKKEQERQAKQIEQDFTFQRADTEGEAAEEVKFDLTERQKELYTKLSRDDQEKLTEFVNQVIQTHREGSFQRKISFLQNFIRGTLNYWEKQLRQNGMEEESQVAFDLDPTGDEEMDQLLEDVAEQVRASEQALLYEDMKTIGERDLPKATVIIKRLAKKLASRISRRYRRTKKSQRIEMRRSIRSNIRYGGTMLDLKYKIKKIEKPKILLVCDVSGSMSRYASFVIQFMYGLSSVVKEIESFIFSDDLERVTPYFKKQRPFEQTMFTIMNESQYWGGGTNLNKSLLTFMDKYKALLTPTTRIILVSDAKTTKPQETEKSLQEMREMVKDMIWLNTLPKGEWGSVEHLALFRKHCRMFECYTLAHLENVMKEHFLSS